MQEDCSPVSLGKVNPTSVPSSKQQKQLHRACCGLMNLKKDSQAVKARAQQMEERQHASLVRSSVGCRRRPHLCSSSPQQTTCRSFHPRCCAKEDSTRSCLSISQTTWSEKQYGKSRFRNTDVMPRGSTWLLSPKPQKD